MCLRPLIIKNNTKIDSPYRSLYNEVPCGECPQCRQARIDAYLLRAWTEFTQCQYVWKNVTTLFLTFTYNQRNVPYYERDEYLDGSCYTHRSYCADFSDIQKALKIFRNKYKDFRFFCTVEFGHRHGRIHYHMIMYLKGSVSKFDALNYLRDKCWVRYRIVQDNKGRIKWSPFIPDTNTIDSLGNIKDDTIKMDASNRSLVNCFKYIVKYVVKDAAHKGVKFSGSHSLRVRSSIGFGLGPIDVARSKVENKKVYLAPFPFSINDLKNGKVSCGLSTSYQYHIPQFYYNQLKFNWHNFCKNASYVKYDSENEKDKYILSYLDCIKNSLIPLYQSESIFNVSKELDCYLKSLRIDSYDLRLIKEFRKQENLKRVVMHFPNAFLYPYSDDDLELINTFCGSLDYLYNIYESYDTEYLVDSLSNLVPLLHRTNISLYHDENAYWNHRLLPYSLHCSDEAFPDIVKLFNFLNNYFFHCNFFKFGRLKIKQREDELKTNYNHRFYEKLYLTKCRAEQCRDSVLAFRRCKRFLSDENNETKSRMFGSYC